MLSGQKSGTLVGIFHTSPADKITMLFETDGASIRTIRTYDRATDNADTLLVFAENNDEITLSKLGSEKLEILTLNAPRMKGTLKTMRREMNIPEDGSILLKLRTEGPETFARKTGVNLKF